MVSTDWRLAANWLGGYLEAQVVGRRRTRRAACRASHHNDEPTVRPLAEVSQLPEGKSAEALSFAHCSSSAARIAAASLAMTTA
jgi:hypothetical protein